MLHSYIRDITHSCTCDMTHSYIRDTPLGKGDGSLQVGQTDTAFKAHVIGPLLVYEACHTWNCVAVCCSVLQCVAVCCSVLQCVAVCCSVLQCRRVHAACYTWNYVAVHCSVFQCVATLIIAGTIDRHAIRATCHWTCPRAGASEHPIAHRVIKMKLRQ